MNCIDYFLNLPSGITAAPEVIGTPVEDAAFTTGAQERMDSCAVKCQQNVLNMFGTERSEDSLIQDAIDHGEYCGSGTAMENVGNLLERNGVNVNKYQGATMAHIISEISQNHKVIVGVDSSELHTNSAGDVMKEKLRDLCVKAPDHAIIVSDVNPYTLEVKYLDPADDKLHSISGERFSDAWDDSGSFMVTTKESPDEYSAHNAVVCGSRPSFGGNSFIDCENANIFGIDTNNDGVFDALGIDIDGDGIADMFGQGIDINGDGIADMFGIDVNGDGIADMFGQGIDINGDGTADIIGVDINGDGIIDGYIEM